MEQQNKNKNDMSGDDIVQGQKTELDEVIKKHAKELRKLKEQLKEQEDQSTMVEALQIAAAAKDSRIEELSKLIDRERQEFKNYRKRTEEKEKDLLDEGKGMAVVSLFGVLDTVYNAISMITDSKIAEGVAMIARKMESVLVGLGVQEISCLGELFDPELHNALMRVEVDEKELDGRVVEVFQKGYRLGDKVLRHSQVKVAFG